MTILVMGGSGSGKSAWAEERACALSAERKYYLAAMQATDPESRERIARHQRQRSGKGFITIEQPAAVQDALKRMEAGESTVLLECISNLTANEMFAGETPLPEEVTAEKVISGIMALKRECRHLVLVSNNVFEDGVLYHRETMAYLRAMGRINQALAELADEAVEVVVGIPIMIKAGQRG